MKRVLGLFACSLLCACLQIKLEEYPRAFACDHNGGDGGPQCAAGWACGFDDRCFDNTLDGGQLVDQWRCASNVHCPTGWKCGEAFEGVQNCQKVDAGAPSRCATDDGCQGGWRCAATNRCFDPADTDGGSLRDCVRDGACPNGFRCGQKVGEEQKCIQLDAGAPSLCNDDEGCEGGFRCDTSAHRCVLVTDVVSPGQLGGLGVTLISPIVSRPAPLRFAITRLSLVPTAFGGSVAQNLTPGLLMASLQHDGGLRVVAQSRDGQQQADGGNSQELFEAMYAIPGNPLDVTDLVVTANGPVVRFRDAGVARLWSDAGMEHADLIRQADPLDPNAPTLLLVVQGNRVKVGNWDAGIFPGPVREAVFAQGQLYAITDQGMFLTEDAGPPRQVSNGPLPRAPSLGVIAGFTGPALDPNPRLGVILQALRPGGQSSGLFPYLPEGPGGPMGAWMSPPEVLSACPDGGAPAQLSFALSSDLRSAAVSRCSDGADGGFPVFVHFAGGMPNYTSQFSGFIEDQVPFSRELVPQRASPFVRAHAASDGRVWYAQDRAGRGVFGGGEPLQPLLLDRQPGAVVSFQDVRSNTSRVFAQSQGVLFQQDPAAGLVSPIDEVPVVPLAVIPENPGWIVVPPGVIDLASSSSSGARLMAILPQGAFVPPVSAAATRLLVGGRLREVIIVASGDTIWVADVTDASGFFSQPATFEPVLVPAPGVRLRSLALEASDAGISGYLTTSTENLRFDTADLVRWSLKSVAVPSTLSSRPLEVWAERAQGRTGFGDGRVWSLPIMVPLTHPLTARDGGALAAADYARKCGDLFVATSEGVFRAQSSPDGGLPRWAPVDVVNQQLDSLESLRLYETRDDTDRLFVCSRSGRLIELTSPTICP